MTPEEEIALMASMAMRYAAHTGCTEEYAVNVAERILRLCIIKQKQQEEKRR